MTDGAQESSMVCVSTALDLSGSDRCFVLRASGTLGIMYEANCIQMHRYT